MISAQEFRKHIRKPVPVYTENGLEYLMPDICNRMFTLSVSDEQSIRLCAEYLRGYCYRHFCGGQMEHVLDDLVIIAYIRTPEDVIRTVRGLRSLGIIGKIACCAEYVEGSEVYIKNF